MVSADGNFGVPKSFAQHFMLLMVLLKFSAAHLKICHEHELATRNKEMCYVY